MILPNDKNRRFSGILAYAGEGFRKTLRQRSASAGPPHHPPSHAFRHLTRPCWNGTACSLPAHPPRRQRRAGSTASPPVAADFLPRRKTLTPRAFWRGSIPASPATGGCRNCLHPRPALATPLLPRRRASLRTPVAMPAGSVDRDSPSDCCGPVRRPDGRAHAALRPPDPPRRQAPRSRRHRVSRAHSRRSTARNWEPQPV